MTDKINKMNVKSASGEKNISDSLVNFDDIHNLVDESNEDQQVLGDEYLKKLMQTRYTYPEPENKNFQEKIYNKREFYYHRIPDRPKLDNYETIRDYREKICNPSSFGLLPQQAFLSNYINPDTPYKGVLVMAGTGTGKTGVGISIAEKFKPLVQKYGTKIHILVPGPIIKENWKDELLKTTGETYMKQQDNTTFMNEQDKQKAKKAALSIALQYYRFMSYRSFYKKVLGEKIIEKVKTADNKTKVTYKKNEEGEFERDVSIDRIYNLNNTLIIIDEAHGLTGNAYGEALAKIIKNSHNLKVVLLSATPMKNLADNIIELINFLRPTDDPIQRDRIFTSHKNHEMELKQGGLEYLKDMTRGYVSYLRGADQLTFAKRVDMGIVPKGLLFTKVVQCKMLPFQRKVYNEAIKFSDDALDKKSEAVANFAFPCINDKKELVGCYGREGINTLRNQLKNYPDIINKKVAMEILNDKSMETSDLVMETDSNNQITGNILKINNLKYFSIKFYTALKKISRLYWGKKGPKTAFVYSNLVKVGIEIFQEILLVNGYLEYDDNPNNYKISGNTICYFCGKPYSEHISMKGGGKNKNNKANNTDNANDINDSNSSTEYPPEYYNNKNNRNNIPEHTFRPATFVVVTGKSSDDTGEVIPEEKQYILRNVFNGLDNVDGKNIKFVLGSKVMNEGLSLKFISEIHILDVYFNLGKVDQCIGRGIRHCSHYELMTKENPFPQVKVYKYAVSLGNELSSEEELYRKAELKYLLIKKVERALKEVAIDCPLNRSGNIFPEEVEEFKNCKTPENMKEGDVMCPALCDYMNCNFKCDSKILNNKYFNETENKYRALKKTEIDYSTFTETLARSEIEASKAKIKELYRVKYLYTLKDILNYIRNSYEGDKKDLFDDFFVFQALSELTPTSENDFNNFRDTIFDKYNRQGYLIYIDKFYIFQPFDQNENIPMYYRTAFDKPIQTQLSLYNYLKNMGSIEDEQQIQREDVGDKMTSIETIYDFNTVMDYYESRKEFKYVGIIDKEPSRRKVKSADELQDVFKIRDKRPDKVDKKRTTGLSSMFGSVCPTSRDWKTLAKIAKELGVVVDRSMIRGQVCDRIKDRLLFLEKYSTDKKKNKFTYIMVPRNHPEYKFPYNLEDRKDYTINNIKENIKFKLDMLVKENKITVNKEIVITYTIEITNDASLNDFNGLLRNMGFELKGNKWVIRID